MIVEEALGVVDVVVEDEALGLVEIAVQWANPKDIGKTEFKEFLQKMIELTQFTKVTRHTSKRI